MDVVDGNALITIVGIVAATATTSATLALWISKEFSKTRTGFYDTLEKQREAFEEKVDKHERDDENRHIENLGRFSDIRVILASMGAGVPPTRKPHS